jgi:hypothetical protein
LAGGAEDNAVTLGCRRPEQVVVTIHRQSSTPSRLICFIAPPTFRQ